MNRKIMIVQSIAGVLLLIGLVFGAMHTWDGRRAGAYYLLSIVLPLISIGLITWTNRLEKRSDATEQR